MSLICKMSWNGEGVAWIFSVANWKRETLPAHESLDLFQIAYFCMKLIVPRKCLVSLWVRSLNNSFRGLLPSLLCPTYEKSTLTSASFQHLLSSFENGKIWVSKRCDRKMKRMNFNNCSDYQVLFYFHL